MKKHRRLQQLMITREGKRTNLIAAQCTRHCAALVLWNSAPSLFSTLLSVLQCNLTTVAVFLNPSLIDNCSIFFILLCLQSAAYDASSFSLLLSLVFLFISCLWPPQVHALLLPQNICLLDQLLPYLATSFNSFCACGWLLYKTFFIVCCLFSISWFIGMVDCFQNSRLIHLLFYMYNCHWEAWDLLTDCLAGQVD